MDRIPTKIKWKLHALFITLYFNFYGTSYKKLLENTATRSFFFLLLLWIFTSADIIFHKFLELYSTLSEKNNFITNFLFIGFTQPTNPHPLKSQNLLSVTKAFSWCSLTRSSYQFFYLLLFTSSVVDPYHFLQHSSRELHSKVPEKRYLLQIFHF